MSGVVPQDSAPLWHPRCSINPTTTDASCCWTPHRLKIEPACFRVSPICAPAERLRSSSLDSQVNVEITDDEVERLRQLLDKQEITEVLLRRRRAGDHGDAAGALACYHEMATE